MIILKLLIILVLILLNGFFVAAEFALVNIRSTKVRELIRKRKASAKLIKKARSKLDQYISATQLGITLASLAIGWIGEPTVSLLIEPLVNFLPQTLAHLAAHTISVILAFLLITYFHIVLGELVPKTMALEMLEEVALLTIRPLEWFNKLFTPFIAILRASGNLSLKLLRITKSGYEEEVYSEDEIKMLLAQSAKSGAIEPKETEMILKVFKLADVQIKEVMVSKSYLKALQQDLTVAQVLRRVRRFRHSRFPVYRTELDRITGFVHVKDFHNLDSVLDRNKPLSKTGIIRKILQVPEKMKADDVLAEMRNKQTHMAVVVNKQKRTIGLVTLEDIIESVTGEIKDEFETI